MIKLITSEIEFNMLHGAVDTRRSIVKVDRSALQNLLIDHAAVLANVPHKEPEAV